MEALVDYYLIMVVTNIVLVLLLTISFNYCLDLKGIRKRNKELERINNKFNKNIIQQAEEIKRQSVIIDEYRKMITK